MHSPDGEKRCGADAASLSDAAGDAGRSTCKNEMRDNELKINPPLYLVGKKICCWNCEEKMPAIALLAPNVVAAEDAYDVEITDYH